MGVLWVGVSPNPPPPPRNDYLELNKINATFTYSLTLELVMFRIPKCHEHNDNSHIRKEKSDGIVPP